MTPGNYGCYHGRGTVAACAPGYLYLPAYWFSRFPTKVPPTWNLLKIFDPQSWTLIFISTLSVTIVFWISARIGTSYFGLKTFTEEIILSPFRSPLDSQIDH